MPRLYHTPFPWHSTDPLTLSTPAEGNLIMCMPSNKLLRFWQHKANIRYLSLLTEEVEEMQDLLFMILLAEDGVPVGETWRSNALSLLRRMQYIPGSSAQEQYKTRGQISNPHINSEIFSLSLNNLDPLSPEEGDTEEGL